MEKGINRKRQLQNREEIKKKISHRRKGREGEVRKL
jgi:hypothetical protein